MHGREAINQKPYSSSLLVTKHRNCSDATLMFWLASNKSLNSSITGVCNTHCRYLHSKRLFIYRDDPVDMRAKRFRFVVHRDGLTNCDTAVCRVRQMYGNIIAS